MISRLGGGRTGTGCAARALHSSGRAEANAPLPAYATPARNHAPTAHSEAA